MLFNTKSFKSAIPNPTNPEQFFLLQNNKLTTTTLNNLPFNTILCNYFWDNKAYNFDIELSKKLLPKIDIDEYMLIQSYDILSLNHIIQYKTKALQVSQTPNKIKFNTTVIAYDDILKAHSPFSKRYPYLNCLYYGGDLCKVLYEQNILSPKNDLFIYICQDGFNLSIYKNKTRVSNFMNLEGFKIIFEVLQEYFEDYEEFLDFVGTKGLDKSKYTSQNINIYYELKRIYLNIIDKLIFHINLIKEQSSISTLQTYILLQKDSIFGFDTILQNRLNSQTQILTFNINNIQIDAFCYLSLLKSQDTTNPSINNFTILPKTKTLQKTSTHLMISIILAFVTYFALLFYNQQTTTNTSNKIIQLQTNLTNQAKTQRFLQTKQTQLTKQINHLNNSITIIKQKIQILNTKFGKLYNFKTNYKPVFLTIIKLSKYFKNTNISLKSIQIHKNNNQIILHISSNSFTKLKQFIKTISKSIHITNIQYKKTNNIYYNTLTIRINDVQ